MNLPSPVELLQTLLRFDTSNPPGNELPAVQWASRLLEATGLQTEVLAKSPNRPNLLTRLPGRGEAPPLLLYGHMDVAPTQGQSWRYPPFEAQIEDGFVWGRGALDMKSGVAMFLAVILRARTEAAIPPGDVILALVSDEEAGGENGARFLVEEFPDRFTGVRHALGEYGGFTFYINGLRFYPIMVAEKQACYVRATLHGPSGHGSLTLRGGATARLARFLEVLDKNRLPVHITEPARLMFAELNHTLPMAMGLAMRQLLNPALCDLLLDRLGEIGQLFDPLLHNTVNITMLKGGIAFNVVPPEIHVGLDGRLLPGFTPDQLLAELYTLLETKGGLKAGEDVTLKVEYYSPGPTEPDMSFFPRLSAILQQADSGCHPAPLLLPGVTDGRFFSRLGIQTYGYLPMRLPADFSFARTIHAADERIPVEALAFGSEAIYQAIFSPR
jgi:acetylornithine deacetylase/succinyl-diaminopimelate desuccinylase-like protein